MLLINCPVLFGLHTAPKLLNRVFTLNMSKDSSTIEFDLASQ